MPSPTPSGCASTNCRSRPTACSRRWRSAGARAMAMRAKRAARPHDLSDDWSISPMSSPRMRGPIFQRPVLYGSPFSRGRQRSSSRSGIRLMDALPEFALVRATSLDDVIRARSSHPASSLLGGGTDLVVNIRRGIVAPSVLIDVNHVEELRAIKADARTLEIGAAVKLAELAAHPEVTRHYPVVAQAAGFIAGPTHRNMGTVGGNLCLDTRCLFYNQSEWWRAAN